jgi:hypothetical protein
MDDMTSRDVDTISQTQYTHKSSTQRISIIGIIKVPETFFAKHVASRDIHGVIESRVWELTRFTTGPSGPHENVTADGNPEYLHQRSNLRESLLLLKSSLLRIEEILGIESNNSARGGQVLLGFRPLAAEVISGDADGGNIDGKIRHLLELGLGYRE